ncbi:MAG TPA: protein kinase [Planctomycetota bacterium]|nr:protein kinase [Planctomycetota bacterium]
MPSSDETCPQPERPDRIGAYRVLDTLGEGGMGTVYLAEQSQPVKRRVALKLIKLGMDSKAVVARFEQERQALAMMQHDGIARVFDCGTTERGQPYFVMELVRGVPLNEFCDRNRLSLAARIRLLQQVCAAVTHAHQKGVVHRDLKPGNVLVSDEESRRSVKIIDFGLAKAMGQKLVEATLFTEAGQVVGTPEYMAPEQADPTNQDIDTRADVYALGVMLYETLTGQLPFSQHDLRRAGLLEMQRVLRDVEPPKPSTRLSALLDATAIAEQRRTTATALRRTLRNDLDWLVLKALEKDRSRRYETANALAMDLQRYLDHEPLSAGPPSLGYRLRKLVRRYRGPIAAAAAIVVATAIGAGLALRYAIDAEDSRREATAARIEAEHQRGVGLLQLALLRCEQGDQGGAHAAAAAAIGEPIDRDAASVGPPLLRVDSPEFAEAALVNELCPDPVVWRRLDPGFGAVADLAFAADGHVDAMSESTRLRLSGDAGDVLARTDQHLRFGRNGHLLAAPAIEGRSIEVRVGSSCCTLDAGRGTVTTARHDHLVTCLATLVPEDREGVHDSVRGDLLVATGSWDQHVLVTPISVRDTTPARDAVRLAADSTVHDLAFGGARFLAAAMQGGYVRVWSLRTLEHVDLRADPTSTTWVQAVAFDASGFVLAAGTEAGVVEMWRLGEDLSVDEHFELRGHRAPVARVAFGPSPHAHLVYSGSSDGVVLEWTFLPSTGRFRPCRSLRTHARSLTAMAIDASGSSLLVGDENGAIVRVDLAPERELLEIDEGWPVDSLAVVGSRIAALEPAAGSSGRTRLTVFAADSGARVRSLEVDGAGLYDVVAEPGSARIAVRTGARGASRVLIWDSTTDERATIPAEALRGASPDVAIGPPRMAWRPHTRQLGVRTLAGVFLFDGDPPRVVWSDVSMARAPGNDFDLIAPASPLAFSPDGAVVYTAGAQRDTLLALAADGSVARSTELTWSHGTGLQFLRISPDGRFLVLGNGNARETKVLAADTLAVVAELWMEGRAANSAAFDPTGRVLALGNGSHASVWSVASWRVVRRYPGAASSLGFDADGTHLLRRAAHAVLARTLFPARAGAADRAR